MPAEERQAPVRGDGEKEGMVYNMNPERELETRIPSLGAHRQEITGQRALTIRRDRTVISERLPLTLRLHQIEGLLKQLDHADAVLNRIQLELAMKLRGHLEIHGGEFMGRVTVRKGEYGWHCAGL